MSEQTEQAQNQPWKPVVTVDLSGKRALVTGAGSGIGRACAEAFAACGAHIEAVDVNAEALAELQEQLGAHSVSTQVCDLSDRTQVSELPGDIDIVVNNAGIQFVSPVHEFPEEKFDQILEIMLHSPFRIIRKALPHMYSRGWGRIVNISSAHGLRASPFKSAYVSAKHGLEGLSKVVALEGAQYGVTSTTVNPAYVRTPLVEKQIADQARTHGIPEDEVVEKIMLTPVAMKRLIEPREVADLVLFLCTDSASSMTGASYPIDGGWTAR